MSEGNAIIAGRVRELVERSGLTQSAFAAAVEMEPTKLSKSLAGSRRFTSLEFALIAEYAGVTVDWLLTGREDRSPLVAARALGDTAVDFGAAIERAEDYHGIYEVLQRLGYHEEPPVLPAVRLSGRNVDQGERLAEAALRAIRDAGRADDLFGDLPTVLESVFGIDVAVEHLPGGPDGLSYSLDGFRLALVNNTKFWTRQRFTLAHELGHILAGDAQDLQLDVDVLATDTRYKATEMRANAFAAALLMPADLVRAEFASGVASEHFASAAGSLGISPSALAWRLLNLGLIDDDRCHALGGMSTWEMAETGGWTGRHVTLVQEQTMTRVPGRLLDRAQRAYHAGDLSPGPLSALLNISVDEFLEGQDEWEDAIGDEPVFIP